MQMNACKGSRAAYSAQVRASTQDAIVTGWQLLHDQADAVHVHNNLPLWRLGLVHPQSLRCRWLGGQGLACMDQIHQNASLAPLLSFLDEQEAVSLSKSSGGLSKDDTLDDTMARSIRAGAQYIECPTLQQKLDTRCKGGKSPVARLPTLLLSLSL